MSQVGCCRLMRTGEQELCCLELCWDLSSSFFLLLTDGTEASYLWSSWDTSISQCSNMGVTLLMLLLDISYYMEGAIWTLKKVMRLNKQNQETRMKSKSPNKQVSLKLIIAIFLKTDCNPAGCFYSACSCCLLQNATK